jgi:hypothetical protein
MEDKKTTRIKQGPVHKDSDKYMVALSPPDKPVDEVAHLISMTPKDYVVDFSDDMEKHMWIARMLGELHTVYEIIEIAKRQDRKGIVYQLVVSIRDHHIWKEAIKKMRVNFLVDTFKEIPLSHSVVRVRELSDMYYRLAGKMPRVRYKLDADGKPKKLAMDDEDEIESMEAFDDDAEIEIEVGGRDGNKTKIKKKKYYDIIINILREIRTELEKADLSLTSEAEFINLIRECGFKSYET